VPAVAPTFSQIRAQVASIRKRIPEAHTIGIHSPGRWTGESEMRDGDSLYIIEQCDSPLALRIALRRERPEAATRILLTSLDEADLAQDIRVRLAKRRLFHIDSWQVLQNMFQAHAVDPRLTRQPWMTECLLEFAAQGDCPAAAGGFLDLETVWAFLLDRGLGLGVARPDLPSVLKWSLDPANVQRFQALRPDFRDSAVEWLAQYADPASRIVLRCVQANERPDALPVGLAAQVVFHPQAMGKLDKAVGRMEERYFGGQTAEKDLVLRWSTAALEVVRLQLTEEKQRERQLKRADALLKEVQADSFAYLSDVSLLGFDQRLRQFGEVLGTSIDGGPAQDLDGSKRRVFEHDQASREPRRLERVTMAIRLARWLRDSAPDKSGTPDSFAEAVRAYLDCGSFVDWARLALRNGDAVAELSESYMALFKKCQAIQEKQAEVFARLLKDWTAAGSKGPDLVPVEQILEEVIAPLAKQKPVLLIVMDGMSVAVFNQLIEDITGREWAIIAETHREASRAGIATIPSLTEFSRTSLLCGALKSGSSAIESAGFAQHPSLVAQSKAGKPPVLFHKTSLHDAEDRGLASEIRDAVSSKDQRVVGVVINAIDDYLLKGEQIDIRWSREEIKALPTLVYEANLANRVVVVVSDHGHILEFSTEYRQGDGGDRWRPGSESPTAREVAIRGKRVLAEGNAVVVPWSETIRYAVKKNGYHGGVTPQEMVIPVAVLAAGEPFPEGWAESARSRPPWWEEDLQDVKRAKETVVTPAKPPEAFPESLLDWREEPTPEEPSIERMERPAWIETLLNSPVFEEQKRLAGRSFPKDEDVLVRLLAALERNGGKMTSTALAHCIDYPPIRLRGLLAVTQRVLNLDGYEVLGRDEDSDTIELNLALLRKQFEIG
jgi:hypothetical protein